ncbi:MAG TPA: FAD-dependent oxidoreductase, partial [Dehalococcoidia bacterium]
RLEEPPDLAALGAAFGMSPSHLLRRLTPGLADAEFRAAWAGLRPGTPDALPILGPVPGREGLLLATGHFRNGVLLSAVTAPIIADLATGRMPEFSLEPFRPERFLEGA